MISTRHEYKKITTCIKDSKLIEHDSLIWMKNRFSILHTSHSPILGYDGLAVAVGTPIQKNIVNSILDYKQIIVQNR